MAAPAAWLLKIDPDPSHWEDNGLNRWTNTASGKKYNSSDMLKSMLQDYADSDKPTFIPGITKVPDELKVIPKGMTYEEYIKHAPPADWDIIKERENGTPPAGGGTAPPTGGTPTTPGTDPGTGGSGYLPGSTWNPGTAGSGFNPMPNAGPQAAPAQWTANAPPPSRPNPERTGLAQAFSPFGEPIDYSTEILRYGGAPRSVKLGQGSGSWTGIQQALAGALRGTPTQRPVNQSQILPPEPFKPVTNVQRPVGDSGIKGNVTTSTKDGTVWTDPATGVTYTWRNGQWQKTDLTNRTGPVERRPVVNQGGTGTAADPIRIRIGGSTGSGKNLQ